MSEKKIEAIVVDDQPEVAAFLEKSLNFKGISVRKFSSAAEALEDFKTRGCDLFIIDVVMPGTGGTEMVRRIREINREVPIIMMTGYHYEELQEVQLEVSAVLYKPFAMRALFDTVNEVKLQIESRKRQEESSQEDSDPGKE